ncbi:hypothetical protein ACFPRL_04945 [Pseudoclavibacter helvolus]
MPLRGCSVRRRERQRWGSGLRRLRRMRPRRRWPLQSSPRRCRWTAAPSRRPEARVRRPTRRRRRRIVRAGRRIGEDGARAGGLRRWWLARERDDPSR